MERIQKRLDVIVAVAGDEYATRRQESSMRMDELMGSIEDKFGIIKEKMKINPSAFLDDVREELADLRNKYTVEKEHRMQFRRLKDFYQRNLIKGNPTMYSKRFGEALEDLKKTVNEKKEKKSSKK